MKIFKHVLDGRNNEAFGVGKILHVDTQDEDICFWYEYDHTVGSRHFIIVGTGQEFSGKYIGTVLMDPFVWHIIEI